MSSHGDPSNLWGWKNWHSLAADQPLFWASIVVNLANNQHWHWERRMVTLTVNKIKSFRNYQQHCKTWKERPHMWKPLRWHFFGRWKTNIERHLRWHYRMPLPIPMADFVILFCNRYLNPLIQNQHPRFMFFSFFQLNLYKFIMFR